MSVDILLVEIDLFVWIGRIPVGHRSYSLIRPQLVSMHLSARRRPLQRSRPRVRQVGHCSPQRCQAGLLRGKQLPPSSQRFDA